MSGLILCWNRLRLLAYEIESESFWMTEALLFRVLLWLRCRGRSCFLGLNACADFIFLTDVVFLMFYFYFSLFCLGGSLFSCAYFSHTLLYFNFFCIYNIILYLQFNNNKKKLMFKNYNAHVLKNMATY
jgi:hypothetical protein